MPPRSSAGSARPASSRPSRSRASTSPTTRRSAGHIRDLATLRFIEPNQAVILHGPVGVGKTHLAQALGHQACRRGYSTVFTKTSRVLADLAGGRVDQTWGAASGDGPEPPC